MNREQLKKLEKDLWSAADKLRANSDLKASEYSTPVLGIIFLKFADNKYRQHEEAIYAEFVKLQGTRTERSMQDIAIERCGFYLAPHARYEHLLTLPEKADVAKAIREAMSSIEVTKPELLGSLPQVEYDRFNRSDKGEVNEAQRLIPKQLLRLFNDIPLDATGDVFGQIYEYFLANFALSEGQGGGEFFTPRSVVRLMTEIIEPHGGKVFDPACGSGGMFVQSAEFNRNTAQHVLRAKFTPFFHGLHARLKALDKAIREMDKRKAEAAKAAGKRAAGNRQTKGVKDAVKRWSKALRFATSRLLRCVRRWAGATCSPSWVSSTTTPTPCWRRTSCARASMSTRTPSAGCMKPASPRCWVRARGGWFRLFSTCAV